MPVFRSDKPVGNAGRRTLMALGAAGAFSFLLSACTGGGAPGAAEPSAEAAPTAPRTLSVELAASGEINPGPTGKPSPLPIEIYVLRSPGRFQSLDYFELKNNGASALSGDLVDSRSLSLRPGQSTTITMTTGGDGAYIGVAAGFREIDSANWRATTSIGASDGYVVRAGRSSVSISAR